VIINWPETQLIDRVLSSNIVSVGDGIGGGGKAKYSLAKAALMCKSSIKHNFML
jgi:hypothetical protein